VISWSAGFWSSGGVQRGRAPSGRVSGPAESVYFMKTYKNLYPQIYNFANLYQAFRAARKGKRGQTEVAGFEFDLEMYQSRPVGTC